MYQGIGDRMRSPAISWTFHLWASEHIVFHYLQLLSYYVSHGPCCCRRSSLGTSQGSSFGLASLFGSLRTWTPDPATRGLSCVFLTVGSCSDSGIISWCNGCPCVWLFFLRNTRTHRFVIGPLSLMVLSYPLSLCASTAPSVGGSWICSSIIYLAT